MYYGQAILSESYLNNIFNHTQMILDSENFINSLYEVDGNKENFLVRIFKFIKEKIMAVIGAIKKVYNWIVEKIKGMKKDSSKLDDVKIVGVAKDEEAAEETINNFKDAVDKANEEVKSAWKDMEDTKANAANNIKQNHEILKQYMDDISESIKKNTESFEDSQKNIDEMLKDIDDSLDDLLDDENKSSNKNLPAVTRQKKKYAILINKDDTIELVNYGALCIKLTDIGVTVRSSLESNVNRSIDKLVEFYNKYDKDSPRIYYEFNNLLQKNINNFDSLKNELEDIYKVENTQESAKKVFHFKESINKGYEHFNKFKRAEYVSENFESNLDWINKTIETLKTVQKSFEDRISEVEKQEIGVEIKNLGDQYAKLFSLEALNGYKDETIESLKICNYLSNYIGRCIVASQQQKLRFENWLQQHLRFIYI